MIVQPHTVCIIMIICVSVVLVAALAKLLLASGRVANIIGRIRRIFLRSSTPSTEQHENEATGNDTHRAFVKPTSEGTSVDAKSGAQNETQNSTSSTTSNATGNDAHPAIVKPTSEGTSDGTESDDQNETQNITSSSTSNATGNDAHHAIVKSTSEGTSVGTESDAQNETQNITSSSTSNATGNDAHRAFVKSTSVGTSVDAKSGDQNEMQNITPSSTSNATGNDAHHATVKPTPEGTSVDAKSGDQNEMQNITPSSTSNGETDSEADDPSSWKKGDTVKEKEGDDRREYTFLAKTLDGKSLICSDSAGNSTFIHPSKLRRIKTSEFDDSEIKMGDKVELLVNNRELKKGQQCTVTRIKYEVQDQGEVDTYDKLFVKFPAYARSYSMLRCQLRKLSK